MKLAERLKIAMDARGVKQDELALAGNIKQQTLSKLLLGKNQTSKALPAFAKKLNIDLIWLQYEKGEVPDFFKSIPPDHLPIIEWSNILNIATVAITDKTPSILKTQNATNACYVLEIQNDMMCSKGKSFTIGEKIIVNPDLKPVNRNYVIAYEKGASLPIFRQYIEDGARIYLRALNSEYNSNVIVNDDIKILGVVIAHVDLLV